MKSYESDFSLVLKEQASELNRKSNGIYPIDKLLDLVEKKSHAKFNILITGVGKSGVIAKKFAATLASTGFKAFFIHPTDLGHGDLGNVSSDDLMFLISQSGESDEIVQLLPYLKRLKIDLIALTGNSHSAIARVSMLVFDTGVTSESCPNNLAPTTSTTVTLAICDAISICLQKSIDFTMEDFARSHPLGRLGKSLLLTIEEVKLSTRDISLLSLKDTVRDYISIVSANGQGTAFVMEKSKVIGIFTDGDLRRFLLENRDLNETISNVMSQEFESISSSVLAVEALKRMNEKRVSILPIIDEGVLTGYITAKDLIDAGL